MKSQRTLVLIKPDGVQRQLVGRVIARFEDRGLKIVGMRLTAVTRDLAERHYAVHKGRPFFASLVDFITSSPVVAIVLEGPNAISVVRSMVGTTKPHESAPGTIRGDFGVSRQMNLVHGSDSTDASAREIAIYFKPEELLTYSASLDPWTCAGDEK